MYKQYELACGCFFSRDLVFFNVIFYADLKFITSNISLNSTLQQ